MLSISKIKLLSLLAVNSKQWLKLSGCIDSESYEILYGIILW